MTIEGVLRVGTKTAPKRIFAYVKRRLRPVANVPVLEGSDGRPLTSSTDRASALATHFASVFASDQVPVTSSTCTAPAELNSLDCNIEEVRKLLANLDGAKPTGPDGVHPLILKSLSAIIAPSVTELFNRSLSTGLSPDDWKCSVLKPILKVGNPSKVDNYRPICLTAVLAKTLEKIVKKNLLQLLESKNLLTSAQHGFLKGRSCITNLLSTRHEWLQAMNKGHSFDVIYIDFSKAFDKVNHAVLLDRLRMYGVGGSLHKWIRNFLVDRKWRVQVDDRLTNWYPSSSGVPQCTVLGPILFLIHVKDVPQLLQSPCALFADDLKVWRVIRTLNVCGLLQHELDNLLTWSAEVNLPINPAKSQFMRLGKREHIRTYTVAGQPLHPASFVRDLGVLSRCDLKSIDSTNRLYQNSLRMLWALRRSFNTWSEEIATRLFVSIIRPMIEYGSPAYGLIKLGEIEKLERVQHVATRLILNLRGMPYEDRCKKLGLYTLAYRRLRVDLIMTHRILHLSDYPMLRQLLHLRTPSSTRGHRYKLIVPQLKRVAHQLCFERRVVNT
ncbi:unnamed protein product [Dicrocoelium dendriticum]|nr:unnamed protein product [Dicrocoelium dendriticum]